MEEQLEKMEEQLEKEYHTPILVEDLGMRFPTENSKEKRRFGLFKCFCGNEFEAQITYIKNGHTRSCGCLKHNKDKITHGLSKERLYNIWSNMIQRCNNPKVTNYHNYGGRGITVCKTWQDDYTTFRKWALANGYSDKLSIDRINVDGNYEPSNCRWTTTTVQNRNTRLLYKSNTSGYRGVSWNKSSNKWQVKIKVNNKNIHLGSFNTPEEGAVAYNNYIIENNLEHTLNIIKISEKNNSEKNNSEKTYYKSKYY